MKTVMEKTEVVSRLASSKIHLIAREKTKINLKMRKKMISKKRKRINMKM